MNKTLQTYLLVTQITLLTAILSVLLVIAGILRRETAPISLQAAPRLVLPEKPYLVP